MSYDQGTLYRFTIYAIPLLLILLALFGFVVDAFDLEPQGGGVVKLTLFGSQRLSPQVVFGAWLLEAIGLLTLYLLIQGRAGFWWLDGLVTGWIAWVFRGPLLVITIVTATGQRQDPWWTIALGWWVLYSVCGLSLAVLARRSWLRPKPRDRHLKTSRARGDEIVNDARAVDGHDETSPLESGQHPRSSTLAARGETGDDTFTNAVEETPQSVEDRGSER